MIEVSRLKDENAAELFLSFRIGAVGSRDFAVFPVQGQRGLRRLKRYFGNKMSVGAQMVVVLKALVEYCVSLVLSHPFKFPRLDVSQTDVSHRFLLLWVGCSVQFELTPKAFANFSQGWSVATTLGCEPKLTFNLGIQKINYSSISPCIGSVQFELTPKAFANFSPGLERCDNPGLRTETEIQPWDTKNQLLIDFSLYR